MDNKAIGRKVLEKLRMDAKAASAVQRRELRSILSENADTEYGSRHGFAGIEGVEDFQSRVPITTYEDYHECIERMIAGEHGVLTASDPVYYAITSGSTDVPKYVPVTEHDMRVHLDYIHCGIMGMVDEYFASSCPDILSRKVFQVGEFARTALPSGVMCGVRSASLYQWLDRDGSFDVSSFSAPKEVLFPDELEDLTYVKVRFALAERHLASIHSVFLHRIVSALDYIRNNWSLLLRDIERGDVDPSIPLSSHWRERLRAWLPPDPGRAAELRGLGMDEDAHDMIRRIWPEMRYLIAIGGQSFPVYEEAISIYGPDIPMHHFIYGASEGFLSIANGVGRPDEYILIPAAGLFEFIPADGEEDHPLLMGELERGMRYELVFTNHSGLYRYRMRDVLEVVGFFGEAPVIRFCHRVNQMLNVADEKVDAEQLGEAMRLFCGRMGIPASRYCFDVDFSMRPGRYIAYIEGSGWSDADKVLDECLCRASYGYRGCRLMGDISMPHVRFLPIGTFRCYEERIASTGRAMAQYKPALIVRSKDMREFLAAVAGRHEKEEGR